MTDLATLVVKLEAQTAQYQAELKKATSHIAGFQRDVEHSLAHVGRNFIEMAAAVAGPAAIGALIKSTLEYGTQLARLSSSTGVSVEQLSSLALVAKQSGLDIGELAMGMKTLGVAISTASGNKVSQQAIAFKLLNINVHDATGNLKDANAVMLELADTFAAMEDGPNKVALAVALFGRQGAALIPVLDKGSAGIDELTAKLREAGGVMTTEGANKSAEFTDKIDLLTTSLKVGLGGALIDSLLPMLDQYADGAQKAANKTQEWGAAAEVLGGLLKTVLVVGDSFITTFYVMAKAEGAFLAAQNQFLQGNFKVAGHILSEFADDAKASFGNLDKNVKAAMGTTAKTVDDQLSEISISVKKWKLPSPNLAAAVAAEAARKKAADDAAAAAKSALATLATMDEQLAEQVATFDGTNAAAIRYRLTLGSLSDEVKKAGAKGRLKADDIIARADALQVQQDAKAIQDGIAGIDEQIMALQGDVVGASLAAFAATNKELIKTAAREGDAAAMDKIAQLRDLTQAQAQYNQLQEDAQRIQDELAIQEQRIQNNQILGTTTELDGLQQLSDARAASLGQLQDIEAQMQAIGVAANNPAILKGAQQLGAQVEALAAQTHLLADRLRGDFVDAAAQSFSAFISGAQSAQEAVLSFLRNITQALIDLVAKHLAEQIFSGAAGSGSGGLFSLIAGALTSNASTGSTIDVTGMDTSLGMFAKGGSFQVGGSGGTDTTPVSFMATRGETVSVTPAGGALNQGMSLVYSPVITIDSRSDRAQVQQDTARTVRQGNRDMLELLRRYNPGLKA